jgi:dTDP-4-amino-4,6-dideoxygalactose transaminase
MKVIRFNSPYITNQELDFIKDVFKENQFYGVGKYTHKCEKILKKTLSNPNVLLTDSCTSALEIAALIIKKNKLDEVLMPSYTFSSTASAFIKAGFKIRFVDIDPNNGMIDPNKLKKDITKKTRAIVVVHYGGNVAQVEKIKKICKKNKLYLVEDAAQSFNSFLNKKAVGTFGDIGCYSFHETKNLHAGMSGALVIKSKKNHIRATYIRERGTNRSDVIKGLSKKYSWVEIGGSYYPTEIQAAFLYAQLKNIIKNTNKRKILYNRYFSKLIHLKNKKIIFFNELDKNYSSNFHAFYILVNSQKKKDELIKYLLKKKINSYIGYVPLHSSKVGIKLGLNKFHLPNTNIFAKTVIRLPMHNNMSLKDVDLICDNINKFYEI